MPNDITKECTRCRVAKPHSEFSPRGDREGVLRSQCRECVSEAARKRRAENPEKKQAANQKYRGSNPDAGRGSHLKRHYGISLEDYDRMLKEQGGVCKICREECKTGRRLAVDHCHETGKVRGLLCYNCNRGLGHYQDSIELLQNATEYLKESRGQ
jgi:hypothetical protein